MGLRKYLSNLYQGGIETALTEDRTIGFNNSMSATDMQALIDAQPKFLS